jgi:hypothetical protein
MVTKATVLGFLCASLCCADALAVDARTPVVPYLSTCSMGSSSSASMGRCDLPKSVPAGKRLIIETVTGVYYGDGTVLGAAYLTVSRIRFAFPWVQSGALTAGREDRRFYGFNHYGQIYVDGPQELVFDVYGGASYGSSASYSGEYAVAGYLVDLPPP